MAVLCVVWDSVLERFNATSKTLHWSGNLCFYLRKLAYIRQFHPRWRSLHCLRRQSKIDDGRLQLSYRTWASKGEEAVIQWGVFRGRPRAVPQGKIQNFNISSHFRFFVDGISSENGSGLSVHLADIFWSVTTRICLQGTLISIDIEEEVFEDEIIQLVDYIKQRATEAVSLPACLRRIREGGIP